MEETLTIDQREQRLIDDQSLIGRLRARQMEDLEVLDRAQVATGDGSRSLSEWAATRLDLSLVSAKSLVRTMRRTVDRPDLRDALASGEFSFDRVEALSKIQDDVGLLSHLDVGGVYREAAQRSRITAADEVKTAENNYLFVQYTLDETWARIQGGLDGYSASLVDKTLTEIADAQPDLPDGTRGLRSWRKATALVELCTSGGEETPPAQVTVFVDATEATVSNGGAGVMLEAGPKVGVQALEAILCDATNEVTVNTEDGVPMVYGRKTRTVPPALRRAVIHRDGGVCAADGCNSRYRIEAHHKTPWSEGGSTDADDLIALCWFHHHIVIHQRGFQIYRHPDHGRIRSAGPNPEPNHPIDLARGGPFPPPDSRSQQNPDCVRPRSASKTTDLSGGLWAIHLGHFVSDRHVPLLPAESRVPQHGQ